MAETKNIMIVGVGGQGTLLTSRILGGITVEAGYDVKLSEVHGMAQRGGSVVTYVRYGFFPFFSFLLCFFFFFFFFFSFFFFVFFPPPPAPEIHR